MAGKLAKSLMSSFDVVGMTRCTAVVPLADGERTMWRRTGLTTLLLLASGPSRTAPRGLPVLYARRTSPSSSVRLSSDQNQRHSSRRATYAPHSECRLTLCHRRLCFVLVPSKLMPLPFDRRESWVHEVHGRCFFVLRSSLRFRTSSDNA